MRFANRPSREPASRLPLNGSSLPKLGIRCWDAFNTILAALQANGLRKLVAALVPRRGIVGDQVLELLCAAQQLLATIVDEKNRRLGKRERR